MADVLQISTENVPELLRKLQDRKAELDAELSTLGSASAELSELLRLCRGFERSFSTSVKSLETAFYIKEAFLGEQGLAGKLRRLPIDKKFRLDIIKQVCREADGYQPHLVSPEKGLRRLVEECIQLSKDPVSECVERVHMLLAQAAREASKKALVQLTPAEVADMKLEKYPGFERAVVVAATEALEEWKKESLQMASVLVEMEASYITAAYFRRALANRAAAFEEGPQLEEEEEEAETPKKKKGSDDDDDDDDESSDEEEVDKPARSRVSRQMTSLPGGEFDPNDLKAGYLEKRIGESSGRASIPVESWKWQKRWFIFTDTKGMLYYFKSPDDPPNYRGAINIRECLVEDLDADGFPKSASRSKHELEGGAGSVSLLIRVSQKDPNKPIIKNHHSIVLRAPTPAEKFDWLARLRHASDPNAGKKVASTRRSAPAPPGKGPPAASKTASKDEDDVDYYKYSSVGQQASALPIGGRKEFNIGIGTAVPFYESNKALAPIPPWKYVVADEGFRSKFDAYLEQLGQDCNEYARVVLDTITTEVPKSVVHCMVRRSTDNMLARLYDHITRMQPWEVSSIMEEDSGMAQKRAATATLLNDVASVLKEVEGAKAATGDKVTISRKAVELGGMLHALEAPAVTEVGTPAASPTTTRSLSPAPARPPTPPSSAVTGPTVSVPPQAVAPSAPSPRPRRRPPPTPPAQ